MASFDIYNPAKLPDTNNSENLETFTEYGNDHIESLVDHYEGIVADCTECLEEWSSFRQFVKDNCMH